MKPIRLLFILLALATSAGAFPLVDRKGGPSSEDALTPAIAARANDGLLVWCEQSTKRLRGILVGTSGAPLMDTSFVIGPTPRPARPTVATDGRDFLVAWVLDGRLTVAYIAEGTHVESISSTTDNASDARLVFTGTDYLLLLRSPTEAHLALLDRRGNILRTVTVATSVQGITSAAIAVTPPNALAFWVDALDNQVHGLDVSPERIRNGSFVPSAPVQAPPNAGAGVIGPVIAVAGPSSYLILWTEPPPNSQQMTLAFRALSATGQPLSPRNQVTIDAGDREPVVYWNGTSFTVLYSARRGAVWAVIAMRIGADGQPIDSTPTAIAVLPQAHKAKAAAKVGTNAVVAFESYRTAAPTSVAEIFTMTVAPNTSLAGDEDGTVVSRALPAEDEPAAVWTGDDWVVAWRERRNIGRVLVGRIGPDGTRVDPQGVVIDPIRPDDAAQTDPAIASSGAEAFVVWTDASHLTDGIIRGALIENARTGTLDPHAITISFDATSGATPAVVWDGEEYVVAWPNKAGQLVAVRINRVGRIIDPVAVPLTESPSTCCGYVRPRLAARGDELLLVWQHVVVAPPPAPILFPAVFGYDLLAQRYSRALFPIASRIVLTTGGSDGNEAAGHSVASDPNGYLITWTQASRTSPTVLTAFRLGDFGRTIPLGLAGTGPTSVTWNGQAYLVAHAKQVLTVAPEGFLLSRATALPEGKTAVAISAGGIAPLLLATSLDNESITTIDGFLLTPQRRRPR
ncbi:MAG TPA: hypothetical protein VGR02_10110 [Thermoanaerobaculia bacterium]|jgi:hypothetical protein|nr:hypothetical protein [Thermoanaerobaculia bacterium]